VVGALTIGAPISRVPTDKLTLYSEAVLKAASSLSEQLGYRSELSA
jgi:DNA-binding IclR family transcriptional regulator